MGLDFSITCEQCGHAYERSFSITHNLTEMAVEAGLYMYLWRPKEIGCKTAADIIPLLENGLLALETDADNFRKFNPPNGFGTYEDFVIFVTKVLKACKEHKTGIIQADR